MLLGAGISKRELLPGGCLWRLPIASLSRDFAHEPVECKNVVDPFDSAQGKLSVHNHRS
jgi:hypothetical protein